MSLQEKINEIKEEISGKNLPGTSRKLVNTTKLSKLLDEISESLPNEIKEAEIVVRQKLAILDQAEEESKKMLSENNLNHLTNIPDNFWKKSRL